MKDIVEINGKKYFVMFTYEDSQGYKYIFYTDNTYDKNNRLNVIFGTYEIHDDKYLVNDITDELKKQKAAKIFNEVIKGMTNINK